MPYGYRRRTSYGGTMRRYGRSSGFARSVRRITKAQHLRDTETKKTVAFNQNLFLGNLPFEIWWQPTFAFVAPVGPVANELLEGEEFMNARVNEVATISVNWLNLAAATGAVRPIRVTRYILATNNLPGTVIFLPAVSSYAALSTVQQQIFFQNIPSNFNRFVVETENVTVVQRKTWRIAPPNAPVVQNITNVTTKIVKPKKFFKGKKEFEGIQGISGVEANVVLKGWNFVTVWLYHFEEPVTVGGDAPPFMDVIVDNYSYFKDP